jgi:hypothetical protein
MAQNTPNLFQCSLAEDPRRTQAFIFKLENLKWDKDNVVSSLSSLFVAVDELAQTEVRYYYGWRRMRAVVSVITRIIAWVSGSIGLLIPLLAGTTVPILRELGQYGYVALAIAASFLAANSLFCGTDGHIKFMSTQIKLERIITDARIMWCKYLAGTHETDQEITQGFALILAYSNDLYTTTIAEIDLRGEALMSELTKYQKTVALKDATTDKINKKTQE